MGIWGGVTSSFTEGLPFESPVLIHFYVLKYNLVYPEDPKEPLRFPFLRRGSTHRCDYTVERRVPLSSFLFVCKQNRTPGTECVYTLS